MYKKLCRSMYKKNGIIGGNGRIGLLSDKYCDKGKHYDGCNRFSSSLKHPIDYGLRKSVQVDFVGHLWCFKKNGCIICFLLNPIHMIREKICIFVLVVNYLEV